MLMFQIVQIFDFFLSGINRNEYDFNIAHMLFCFDYRMVYRTPQSLIGHSNEIVRENDVEIIEIHNDKSAWNISLGDYILSLNEFSNLVKVEMLTELFGSLRTDNFA